MATTRIMPVHTNAALGAAQTIKSMADYFKNPDKTDGGLLVSGFECDTDYVAENFMFAREEYQFNTGRIQGDNEILAYHVRQAFLPGEIDAETAHRLGHELAMELTGGKHSFIVCTHIDRGHIHNHIAINAVNLDCDGKFRNEIGSYKRVQRVADRISTAHNLSVIENPDFSKWKENPYKAPIKRDGLAGMIDKVFATNPPKDFSDLLVQLEKDGCKIRRRGKTISIQPPKAERFFRLRAGKKGMPVGYDEDSLRKKIAELQTELQAGLRDDVATDAEIFAADSQVDAAETPAPPTDVKALAQLIKEAQVQLTALQSNIDTASARINKVTALQRHIGAYGKNKDVYSQYLQSKRSPAFRQKNEKAIATVEEARAFFDSLGLEKIPSIKELREEYATLSKEKYACQQTQTETRQRINELQTAKMNAEAVLGIEGKSANQRTPKRGQTVER